MGIFNRNKKHAEPAKKEFENKSFEAFRAINTEGQDLSKPFVDDYYNRGFHFVYFGEENLYPQILNQLYISAPMHQACCNFKKYSLVGNSYDYEEYEKLSTKEHIEIKTFERLSNFKEIYDTLALDWIKHGRVIVLLKYDEQKKIYTHFKHVDPENIRNNNIGLFENRPSKYFYSKDWTRNSVTQEFEPYSQGCTAKWQVLELRNNVGGFKSYGMPDWVSSANWQTVGADLGLLHKSAIENGIQPSVMMRYPYLMSPEERTDWENGMRKNAKGAKNYGRAFKIEANGKDNLPEIDVVKTSDNHRLFQQTSMEYKEEVGISHNLNPALLGVKVAGALGQKEEIEFSAKQFEKIWLNTNREKLENFFNEIFRICSVPAKLKLNKTELISFAIEKEETQSENLTATERQTIDSLKGLSAKENQDIVRIIRDYNKGRLNEPIAVTRLLGYGLTKTEAQDILNFKA